ncbi:YitT family protein [Aquincola sp. S2]|uniref:YitT family protein n=1 Tax=Pseudaquabacterium terrae TaxID=2732868 RepID=A0ABX2EQS7_9BURK|nr:YitT family protein [Aquabacterium terrae]NRF71029.1 YitT family protein [Aquabacterium terrae]
MAGPSHSVVDDLQAGATAVIFASLGLALLNSAGLMTGGTPGLGFLLSYATGMPLGVALFLVNLPFYVLGWKGMGARFTLKTLAAVTGLSLGVEAVRHVLAVQASPMYAALAGGVLIGTGLLVMFRHQASFGGINILALYLQKRAGWPAGKVQMAIDLGILAGAFFVLDVQRVGWSVLGSLAVNAVLVWNHRPGRYSPANPA